MPRTHSARARTYLLEGGRDGALHGAVRLEGVEPALALRGLLQPRELVRVHGLLCVVLGPCSHESWCAWVWKGWTRVVRARGRGYCGSVRVLQPRELFCPPSASACMVMVVGKGGGGRNDG